MLTMMMMIAFVTFKPLIEGLCSSNPWEFEFLGFRRNQTDDQTRGKRRSCSPGVAARHSQYARVHTDFISHVQHGIFSQHEGKKNPGQKSRHILANVHSCLRLAVAALSLTLPGFPCRGFFFPRAGFFFPVPVFFGIDSPSL